MPSAMLLMLIVKLKQVLFHSLNRNIHSRSDVLLRACPKNDKFAKKMSRGSTAILLLKIIRKRVASEATRFVEGSAFPRSTLIVIRSPLIVHR